MAKLKGWIRSLRTPSHVWSPTIPPRGHPLLSGQSTCTTPWTLPPRVCLLLRVSLAIHLHCFLTRKQKSEYPRPWNSWNVVDSPGRRPGLTFCSPLRDTKGKNWWECQEPFQEGDSVNFWVELFRFLDIRGHYCYLCLSFVLVIVFTCASSSFLLDFCSVFDG